MFTENDAFFSQERGRAANSVLGKITAQIESASDRIRAMTSDYEQQYNPTDILENERTLRDDILNTMTQQGKQQADTTSSSEIDDGMSQLDTEYASTTAQALIQAKKLGNSLTRTFGRLNSNIEASLRIIDNNVAAIKSGVPYRNNRYDSIIRRTEAIIENEIDGIYANLAAAEAGMEAFDSDLTRAMGDNSKKRKVWSGGCSYGQHNPSRAFYCLNRNDFSTLPSNYYSISSNTRFNIKRDGQWRVNYWQYSHSQNAQSSILVNGRQISFFTDRLGNGDNGWSHWGGYQNDITYPMKNGDYVQIECDRYGGSWTWHSWNSQGSHGGVQFAYAGEPMMALE